MLLIKRSLRITHGLTLGKVLYQVLCLYDRIKGTLFCQFLVMKNGSPKINKRRCKALVNVSFSFFFTITRE